MGMARGDRIILHVDMNAFFAAVEQQANPALRGKPVLVYGNPDRRGVIATASYEARKYGVRAGMSTWEARQRCPHGIYIEGNPAKYIDVSLRLLVIYRSFTPLVEPFSIDEAFLDVTGCTGLFGEPAGIARAIKALMREETGLTCSIGIAPNKLLAKMASSLQKPDGLVSLWAEDVPQVLWPLPVGKLYGVGEKTEQHLVAMGITTIGDLAAAPIPLLRARFGVVGEALRNMARGIASSPVDPQSALTVKSMGHEITLPEDSDNPEYLRRIILQLADQVARRLRADHYQGKTVTLKIRYHDFRTITRARTVQTYLDLAEDLYRLGWELFSEHWTPWQKIRLVGLTVSNLTNTAHLYQPTLFDPRERLKVLTAAVDGIRDKYGEGAVTRARLLLGPPPAKGVPPGKEAPPGGANNCRERR